jgi:Holliday junction resolvase RusA-like endonuclease
VIAFTVFGTPIPQGSTRAFVPKGWKRPVITHANAKTKPWRQAIVDATQNVMAGRLPVEEAPVELAVTFFLPRPKSAPKRFTEPARKPDTDKLLRAVMDALTAAGVWRDDAQVVLVVTRKAFAGGQHDPMGPAGVPRAEVRVREAPAEGAHEGRR